MKPHTIHIIFFIGIIFGLRTASIAKPSSSTKIIFRVTKGCSLYLTYPRNLIKTKELFIEHAVKDTTVEVEVLLTKPFNLFNTNKGQTPYLMMPGFTYTCILSNPQETQWHFESTDRQKASESNALNELQKLTERFDLSAPNGVAKLIRSSDGYNLDIDNALTHLYKKRLEVLAQFNGIGSLSPEGYNALKAYVKYEYLHNRLKPMYLKRFKHKPLPVWYADSLLKIDLRDIDAKYIALYPVQGVCIFTNRLQATEKYHDASLSKTFTLAKQLPAGEVKNVLLYQIMQLQVDVTTNIYKQYTDSLTKYSNNDVLNQIIFDNLKQALAVNGSKDSFYTLTNQPVTLSKLLAIKDTVLYVDFWASWCMPCLQEMPASFKLRQALKSKAVTFCYISIDKKGDSWKNKSKDIDLTANSYWLPDIEKSAFAFDLKIQSIPRYVIIKNGKIIDRDAPRPSDKNLKQVLLSHVNTL
ncbi:TlpA disulfide reductase family protein [Mucilaginibacter sp. CSA2-8R]|uniref:TlpA family protein disulfide reductase n=1 Tax=Mucilaginibacter sp. CSA2-8R TaxID=3141542 RepID=UPI00315CF529